MTLTGLAVLVAVTVTGCSSSSAPGTSTTPAAQSSSAAGDPPLQLVVVGDSIPYNSPDDCPGCDGFVDQYAAALGKATGRAVEVTNLSSHDNLTIARLVDELPEFKSSLASADAILVGIAHNGIELNADRPCGSGFDAERNTFTDWGKLTRACAERTTARSARLYDQLYSTIEGWRRGEPTILRTIDKYSDWVGWTDAHLTPAQTATTVMFHDLWNTMLCKSARTHDFVCVDIYRLFNGPDGTRPAGDLLGPDYTHPSQRGNNVIAKALIAEGFAPLAP